MRLRCMAYRQDGMYVAACLDFSLAAQGDNIEEAINKLEAQIEDYLEEARAEPQYAKQMLSRKAPLSMWFKYWRIAFRIFMNKKDSGMAKVFNEQCEPA
ncbi:DUF1902 domain-containing protein [Photorhabdus bodei]|uniref:type II toxin-antitoxin system HicB family antitoxin n=1 Tax=Photorhabdus bodei TaxID=2029681 RepID=UPI0032B7F2F0